MATEKIYNIATDETLEIELSAERLAALTTIQNKIDAEQNAITAKLQARQAVLDKLGLTDEEAAALLG